MTSLGQQCLRRSLHRSRRRVRDLWRSAGDCEWGDPVAQQPAGGQECFRAALPRSGIVAQGAVLLYNSQANQTISDVTLRDFVIRDTDPEAYAHVKILSYDNEVQRRLTLANFTVRGGSSAPFSTVGIPNSAFNKTSWTMNNVAQSDQIGF